MNSEIFRFAIVHPPQASNESHTQRNLFKLLDVNSEFIKSLKGARAQGSKASMLRITKEFIQSNLFLDQPVKADKAYTELIKLIESGSGKKFDSKLREGFQRIFNVTPADFIYSDLFKNTKSKLTDSIVAGLIDSSVTSKSRSFMITLAKANYLIKEMAAGETVTRQLFNSVKIVLPEGIFPLPKTDQSLRKIKKIQNEKRKKEKTEKAKKNLGIAEEISNYINTINELILSFERNTLSDISTEQPVATAENIAFKKARRFTLPKVETEKLSSKTKSLLKKEGIENDEIDIPITISMLERKTSMLAKELYTYRNAGKEMIRIGNLNIPGDHFDLDNTSVFEGAVNKVIGICPQEPLESGTFDDTVTIPSGYGEARLLGVADLMLVEQKLIKYQTGEIAHIENVLKSELRERVHRTKKITEESIFKETEETTESQKDLSTTERFELQNESQKVINENTTKEAGVIVNASYGYVDMTANFNYTNNEAISESQRSGSNFARDTISRAVNRIENRNLERRFLRTVDEVEETNTHSFDNKEGLEHITGIYKFVDKLYEAQIVNYGKRMMLEFLVPEPAAFLRYAYAKQPVKNISIIKPDPPGFCINGTNFEPLIVQDITRYNYLFWVSKYHIENVSPPPSHLMLISGSKVSSAEGMKKYGDDLVGNGELSPIDIPEGYYPLRAGINLHATHLQGEQFLTVQIQDQEVSNKTVGGHGYVQLHLNPTKQVFVTINSLNMANYEVIINILCTLSTEKYEEWQLKTYNAIMIAYQEQKSKYENAIESSLMNTLMPVSGSNATTNREIEKTELKKGCISMMTGQRFELFDSVNQNIAPYGYPEIDFEEATAEGRYIQFFEQAFEWTNLLYVFYPYFWSKKNDWLTLAQITDNDPLFAKFLQAGAARVQVPIRIGFETSILHYLELGEIWYGEGELVNSENGEADPMHVSVLDELSSQLSNTSIEGKGLINVIAGNAIITGEETEFRPDDENKRIIINGKTYVIKKVNSSEELELTTAFEEDTGNAVRYSFGGKLVGQPWVIKLPTNLIYLQEGNQL